MPLEEYRAKRDFGKTPEPAGGAPSPDALRFVVQQHHASRMHWDFRLELDGVLLSWAVPKGPSLDPVDKRLAVRTEDHPIDYADFEGVIPAGEYGAGNVIVWDRGTWEPMGDAHAGMAKGDFKFRLFGEKLIGGWVLVKLKPRGNEKGENWLLIKERDEHVRAHGDFDVIAQRPESVISGRTVEEVAEGGGGTFGPPQFALCTLVTAAPFGPEWLAEVKYDGYRLAIVLRDGSARCFSRSGNDVTDRFAALARAAEHLPAASAVLDGEAVVFDDRGATSFGELQNALAGAPERVSFVAFDLLELNGHDLRPLTTVQRQELLATLLKPAGVKREAPGMVVAGHVTGDSAAFLEAACAQGLEGAVFKRADAPYPAGRTRQWLKVKCRREQEFVVGGYTEAQGSRTGFGALLLGYRDETGALRYAGRVGSGFSDRELRELAAVLQDASSEASPFTPVPQDLGGRAAHWVEPRLVVQVAFAEWTPDGLLRQPSFIAVRDDVDPAAVQREREEPDSSAEPEPSADAVAEADAGVPAQDGAVVLGVRVSNPDKRLFPESELTKAELARYYEAIAPWMLPEVAERPLTLVRCPVGDAKSCFYQRHPERGLAAPLTVIRHASANHEESDDWIALDSAAGLVALAQMGVAEIHTWLSRADAPGRPDRIVFDLDPGDGVGWEDVAEAARVVAEECAALGLTPFLKSTGSKGLHVVVPIEPVWEFARVHAMAKAFAESVAARSPQRFTARMPKKERAGRVFIDYVRNSEGASAVAAYSTRHLPGPSVAVPLAWEELDDAQLDIRAFTPARVLQRVRAGVDPWNVLPEDAAGVRALRRAESTLG